MATVKLKFKSASLPDKEGVLVYQVTHLRKTKRIKSRYSIYNNEWAAADECIKTPSPNSMRHDILTQIVKGVQWDMQRIHGIANALAANRRAYTVDDIVREYNKRDNGKSVFDYFHDEVERLHQLGRHRASESCKTTLNALIRFRGEMDFTFDIIDGNLMESFEAHLKQRGVMRNTVGYYIRCVRSVYNRAVERGLTIDRQPFRHVYTSKDKTVKRALCLDDIKAIKNLDLSGSTSLDFARDMFLFSFYTRGMSFVDMAYLRKADLQGGVLSYRRKKTGQLLNIEWAPCMQAIVNKYREPHTQYMLPIITQIGHDERQQYLYKLRAVNRNLKKVGQLAHLSVQLSSYFARHSWASLAHSMNVPISVISEALGHDSETTTQIYLNNIQSSTVDAANRRILGQL